LARVGYFEGTDPLLLSKLAAEGIETIPVANTWDGHGKLVTHLSKGEVNVVVGYLHKVVPAEPLRTAALPLMVDNMLSACKVFDIPTLLIVPANLREKAQRILSGTEVKIQIVSPEQLEAEIRKYL
jgi:hypothetical protein